MLQESLQTQHGGNLGADTTPDICEVPGAILPPSATTPESLEQPLVAQATLPLPEALKGFSQADDQGQGVEGVKDKGQGKEAKTSSVAEDAAKASAKETEARTKKTIPQAKDASALQPSQ